MVGGVSLLNRLLRRATPTDAWSEQCDTVVFYALPDASAQLSPQTPSLVIERFFVEDAQAAFGVAPAPRRETVSGLEFEAVLARAVAAPRRDPNSRGRVEFVRRWYLDTAPAWVTWQLEPAAVAGTGVAHPPA